MCGLGVSHLTSYLQLKLFCGATPQKVKVKISSSDEQNSCFLFTFSLDHALCVMIKGGWRGSLA